MTPLVLELKLVGGLGNQLFQYATARSLFVNRQVGRLWINVESYKTDPFGRSCGLLNYKVNGSVVKGGLLQNLLRKNSKLNKVLSKIPFYQSIEEEKPVCQPIGQRMGAITSLNGYWQSEYYFKNVRKLLLEELVPHAMPDLPWWVMKPETVSVHVRRTDYLREKQFGFLGKRYYQQALNEIRSKLKEPLFIVFSDDLDWCKSEFGDLERVHFVDEPDWRHDYLQLWLMSQCKHQIIANSSFSWWGGWLNDHPGRIIIRPADPFADRKLLHEAYYPAEWVSVSNTHEFD